MSAKPSGVPESAATTSDESAANAAVTVGYVGAVIGAHAGPDTLALFYFGGER